MRFELPEGQNEFFGTNFPLETATSMQKLEAAHRVLGAPMDVAEAAELQRVEAQAIPECGGSLPVGPQTTNMVSHTR